jgi:hypothetical protein
MRLHHQAERWGVVRAPALLISTAISPTVSDTSFHVFTLSLSSLDAVDHLYSYNNVQIVYNANPVNGIVMSSFLSPGTDEFV